MCSDRSDQLRGQRQKTPLRSHRSSACRCASPRAEPRINWEQMHSRATGHDLPTMRTLSRQAHWQMSDPKARNGRHGGSPDGRRRLVMVEKSAPSCGSGCQQGMVVGFGVECLAACVATLRLQARRVLTYLSRLAVLTNRAVPRKQISDRFPRFHFVASRLRLLKLGSDDLTQIKQSKLSKFRTDEKRRAFVRFIGNPCVSSDLIAVRGRHHEEYSYKYRPRMPHFKSPALSRNARYTR